MRFKMPLVPRPGSSTGESLLLPQALRESFEFFPSSEYSEKLLVLLFSEVPPGAESQDRPEPT